MRSWFVPILQFWFGDVDALGRSDVMHSRRWFMKDDAFDREIADRFGETFADVRAGHREAWLDDPRGRVGLRDRAGPVRAQHVPGDGAHVRGRQAGAGGRGRGHRARRRRRAERQRALVPVHAVHAQRGSRHCRTGRWRCSPSWRRPRRPSCAAAGSRRCKYAEKHRDIIARFGRFPHRNAVLGRESRPEEMAFIAQPGSGF